MIDHAPSPPSHAAGPVADTAAGQDRLPPISSGRAPWHRRPRWNRFTVLQLAAMALATIPALLIAASVALAAIGAISGEQMMDLALAAGENPGTIVFGAMFLASPVQWLTGRSQVRVRKYLGIVFFLLACSNAAMFVIEQGLFSIVGAPFLVAGTLALVLAAPLFLTSSRRSQRTLGMHRWRLLHKMTYGVAAALLAHVVLIGDIGPGAVLITLGFIARVRPVRSWLMSRCGS